jgi:hypothetical protein
MNIDEGIRMAMGSTGQLRGGGASAGRPALVHHVVVRRGEEGSEVLRVSLEGKDETLPVFSAGWAARGYLFDEAPGGGWYVRRCTPEELLCLLDAPCAGVEWVALDPRPGRSGGQAANVMPRENFMDYLSCSRAHFSLRPSDFDTTGGTPHIRENDR